MMGHIRVARREYSFLLGSAAARRKTAKTWPGKPVGRRSHLRLYEMLTIFPPYLSEEDLNGAMEQVERYVTSGGGEITQAIKDSPWGRRRLAYTIRHNGQDLRDGFYVLYYFNSEPRAVAELERALQLNDRVVRHMVIRVDAPTPKAQEKKAKAGAKKAAKDARAGVGGGGDRDRDRDRR